MLSAIMFAFAVPGKIGRGFAPSMMTNARRLRWSQCGVLWSVFLLLGGWVWSERRDGVTRVFLLLCLAFAGMLAQAPVFGSPLVQLALPPGKHGVRAVSPSGASRAMTIVIEPGKVAPTRRIEW